MRKRARCVRSVHGKTFSFEDTPILPGEVFRIFYRRFEAISGVRRFGDDVHQDELH